MKSQPVSTKSDSSDSAVSTKSRLLALSALIHRPVALRPNESLESIRMDATFASLSVRVVRTVETAREFRVVGSGLKILMWSQVPGKPTEPWVCEINITQWDEDFKPVVYLKRGEPRSRAEWLERIKWDRMCYRPGTKRSPLDNYDRVLEGNYTESERQIEKYW